MSGYVIDGEEEITCEKDREWSAPAPVCTKVMCGLPPSIIDGENTQSETEFGNEVDYRCQPGYVLSDTSKLICASNGTYIGKKPSCVKVKCGEPDTVEHADISKTGKEWGEFEDAIRYACKPGYELIGEEYRLCNADGTWTPDPPKCEIIKCERPEDIPNGKLPATQIYSFGQKVTYTCDEGFHLVGSPTRTCLVKSQWTGTAPTSWKCGVYL